MFLLLISFLLVFTSSYLLTSIISPRKSILGIIYLFLIAFSQIVLTFEILSLFSAIKQFWVLGLNATFFILTTYIWNKKSRPLWNLDCKDFKNRLNNSLKLDKSLMWIFVAFLTFIIVTIILNLIMPITSFDAQAYHAARSLFWVLQGNLNHFEVADVRNLCLPINSEILYAWIILFTKKDIFLGFFSFVGYWLSMISIFNILGLLGYCMRKRLWVIFILSSFASVLVQASSTETDIIIAGLITSCIFLFWYALKNNQKIPLFMASLAYALAIGTKTTSLIAIPGVGLLLLLLCINYKKYKPLALFIGFGALNFTIFSSYNYILNFIHFSNFTGPTSFMVVSKNYFGIRGMCANFIKYLFLMIDFTGFRWSDYIGPHMMTLREQVLMFLHLGDIQDGYYTTPYVVNRFLLEPIMGTGILGFLVFVPCIIWATMKPLFKPKSRKTFFLMVFAIVFLTNILSISYLLAYMSFSVRFVMSFIVISSPILIYSYLSPKNPLKYVIVAFSLFYLLCVSTHLWPRPFIKLARIIIHERHTISYAKHIARCKDYTIDPQYTNSMCPLVERIEEKIKPNKKILVFINTAENIYMLKALEFKGYKIDFRILENASKVNFNDYDIVILPNISQKATVINDYEKRKNECQIRGKAIYSDASVLVPCLYAPNPTLKKSKNKEKSYPYQSICGISQTFINKNNLQPIMIAGLMVGNTRPSNFYIIYTKTKRERD